MDGEDSDDDVTAPDAAAAAAAHTPRVVPGRRDSAGNITDPIPPSFPPPVVADVIADDAPVIDVGAALRMLTSRRDPRVPVDRIPVDEILVGGMWVPVEDFFGVDLEGTAATIRWEFPKRNTPAAVVEDGRDEVGASPAAVVDEGAWVAPTWKYIRGSAGVAPTIVCDAVEVHTCFGPYNSTHPRHAFAHTLQGSPSS